MYFYTKKKMKEKPDLFLFRENEPKVTLMDIDSIESVFSAKLPTSYIEFQKYFGGGNFAFIELFSLSSRSEYFILDVYKKYSYFPKDFFPISNDEVGGYYRFFKENNIFKDTIYYLDVELENPTPQETKWDFPKFFMWGAFNM